MEFIGRTKELHILQEIKELSRTTPQFVVMTGRRRIGKTSLLLKALGDEQMLYFFVNRTSEKSLCQDFVNELQQKLEVPILGDVNSFGQIFEYIMRLSHQRHITLVIDEFQEFARINPAIFGQMQHYWDLLKQGANICLIVCGSVQTLLTRIFRDNKEPLFGRQTRFMMLEPFDTSTLRQAISQNARNYSNEDLLTLWTITGGVAKYIEQLIDSRALTKDQMLDFICQPECAFIDEGRVLLIQEFGRDYNTYFTILSLIAQGYNSRSQLEDMTGQEISGHLTRLEHDYSLLTRVQPIYAARNKNMKYAIRDNFLKFWFRFFYKYANLVELKAFGQLRAIIERDFDTFSGWALEQYFRKKLAETGQHTRIGGWWDRHGENEIDIIAENELVHQVEFIEVKRNARNLDLAILRAKAYQCMQATKQYSDWNISYRGLSIDDM
ncbi:MAG: AAA family ATPase [Muribaculaceae bacterium]|nr:AAA family ATPase [Muribaculaceae bacterium]